MHNKSNKKNLKNCISWNTNNCILLKTMFAYKSQVKAADMTKFEIPYKDLMK